MRFGDKLLLPQPGLANAPAWKEQSVAQSVSLKQRYKDSPFVRERSEAGGLSKNKRSALSARQPLADDRVEALWVLYVADVRARVDQLDGGAADESGHLPHDGGRHRSVLSAANEERWAFDPAQMALVVKLLECAGAADITSRAGREDHLHHLINHVRMRSDKGRREPAAFVKGRNGSRLQALSTEAMRAVQLSAD